MWLTNEEVNNLDASELVPLIHDWFKDRNMIEGTTNKKQFYKLMSEFGEFCDNYAKGRDTTDDLGDCLVVLLGMLFRLRKQDEHMLPSLLNTIDYIAIPMDDMPHEVVHSFMVRRTLGSFKDMCLVGSTWTRGHHLIHCVGNLCKLIRLSGKTPLECLAHAYNDIKNRKGKMVNGTFIKESDIEK